jgi:hypothetical protein
VSGIFFDLKGEPVYIAKITGGMCMGSSKNNEELDFPVVEEAKISMALAEAEMNKADIHFFSLHGLHDKPGPISQALNKWLSVTPKGHDGVFSIVTKEHPMLNAFKGHKRSTLYRLNDTLQARECQEILLIGKDLSVWDIAGRIEIQRKDPSLVGLAKRVITKMISITKLLEQQK